MATVKTQAPAITNYIRGDSRVLAMQFLNSDGATPFNLTGCTVYFSLNIEQNPPDDGTDSTAAIHISTSVFVNPALGQATLTLTNALTQSLIPQTYWYDIQLKDANGNITSLQSNTFKVVADITTRVT